jgi:hypothetical protein
MVVLPIRPQLVDQLADRKPCAAFEIGQLEPVFPANGAASAHRFPLASGAASAHRFSLASGHRFSLASGAASAHRFSLASGAASAHRFSLASGAASAHRFSLASGAASAHRFSPGHRRHLTDPIRLVRMVNQIPAANALPV